MHARPGATGGRGSLFVTHLAIDISQQGGLHGGQRCLRLFRAIERGTADGEGTAVDFAGRHGQADFLAVEVNVARQYGWLAGKQGRELGIGATIVAPVMFGTAGGQCAGSRECHQNSGN